MRRWVRFLTGEGAIIGGGQAAANMWPEFSAAVWIGISGTLAVVAAIAHFWPQLVSLWKKWKSRPRTRDDRSVKIKEIVNGLIAPVITLLVVLGAIIWLFTSCEMPRTPQFVHPSMSTVEQQRAAAECRMRAMEITSPIVDEIDRRVARQNYTYDCLIAQGFINEYSEQSTDNE